VSPNLRPGEFKYTTYGQRQLSPGLLAFVVSVFLGAVAVAWVLLWSMGVGT